MQEHQLVELIGIFSLPPQPLDIAGAPFVGQSFASGDAFKAYYIKEVASQLGVSVVLSYSSWRCLRFICNRRTTSKCPYAVGLVKSEGTEAWIISDSSVLRHNHGPSVKKRKNSELRPSNRGAASSIKRDVSHIELLYMLV